MFMLKWYKLRPYKWKSKMIKWINPAEKGIDSYRWLSELRPSENSQILEEYFGNFSGSKQASRGNYIQISSDKVT